MKRLRLLCLVVGLALPWGTTAHAGLAHYWDFSEATPGVAETNGMAFNDVARTLYPAIADPNVVNQPLTVQVSGGTTYAGVPIGGVGVTPDGNNAAQICALPTALFTGAANGTIFTSSIANFGADFYGASGSSSTNVSFTLETMVEVTNSGYRWNALIGDNSDTTPVVVWQKTYSTPNAWNNESVGGKALGPTETVPLSPTQWYFLVVEGNAATKTANLWVVPSGGTAGLASAIVSQSGSYSGNASGAMVFPWAFAPSTPRPPTSTAWRFMTMRKRPPRSTIATSIGRMPGLIGSGPAPTPN